MADYENEDDLVLYNGEENVENVEYNDIDDDFCPPLNERIGDIEENNVDVRLAQ